jgi:chemotaxis protein methyltransferase CheR
MSSDIEPDLALERLLETLAETSDYDLRAYRHGALLRRVRDFMRRENLESLDEMDRRVAADPLLRERLTYALTAPKSEFHRNPAFWEAFAAQAIPHLRTYPSLRIWTPACGTGEEAYTLAQALDDAELLRKTRIYATPQHSLSLEPLRSGVYGERRMRPELLERVISFVHNLVTDGSPNEFQLILCRDTLSRFNSALQERALRLFYASLCPFGLLALGESDPRPGSAWEPLDAASRIYRRIG